MLRTKTLISLDDFSGGLNTKAGPLNLADNESPALINCTTDVFKSLKKRSGQTVLNSSALAQTQGNGLYDFAANSTHYLLGAWGTTIQYMSALNGTWNSLKTGRTSATYMFENFVDNTGASHAIICGSPSDIPQTWDGSAGSTSNIAAMPQGTAPKLYSGYVFVTGMTATPSRLQFSALADYTTWPAANYYDEVTPNGDGGVGWGELNGLLYWFKNFSIFRVSYTGGSPLFTRRRVANKGTVAPRTIQNVVVPGTGEVLVFLGTDASLYAFDGSNVIPISIKIDSDNGIAPISLGTALKNVSILQNAWAINDEANHRYILFFANGDTTSNRNNCGIVWDYYSNSFWPWSNQNFLSGCLMTDNNGQKQPFGAAYDGKAYQLNAGNSDNGSNINSYYYTKKMDTTSYPTLKKSRQLWATCKTTGAYSLGVSYRQNWKTSWQTTENITENNGEYFLGSTFTLGTATLGGSEGVTRVFGIGQLNNLFQIQISDNSQNPAWNLYRLDVPEEPLGITYGTG